MECKECKFVVTSPRPDDEDLVNFYPKEDYVSHNDKPKGLFDRVYFQVQKANLRDKQRKIERHFQKAGTLLDYGCGSGSFIHHMQEKGWKTDGVELSEQAAAIAKKRTEGTVESPSSWKSKPEAYDLITMWHVLEHLPNMKDVLGRLTESLKPGGMLAIAVPNHTALDAAHYGADWASVPGHATW
jgi:2-polyprenyl-3-methyl-5-hydroxy-6-metoxy-1,4-benzoquinol methylase